MLKVLSAGVWSSIQDQGRFGYRHLGVPVSGVMDATSANLANLLLNNALTDAVMEITLSGPKLEFQADTQIAITGADISAQLNGIDCHLNTAYDVKAGDFLSFGRLKHGVRTYLAIAKGFQSEPEMDSRSFYSSITDEVRLEKGDLIEYAELDSFQALSHTSVKVDNTLFGKQSLEVFAGPEFDALPAQQKDTLLTETFTLSKNNDRMAYQLEEPLLNDLKPILTSAVLPGTVQLTPAGTLIILMRDCQTTGGYPRVLQLSEDSMCRLSQKKQGDSIWFCL